ncbi:MAG: flagellar FlbD family protein [Eubacteriales bacterium]
MIKLTKLTNETFYMNEDLIEIIEQMPDTLITMKDGRKYYALETPEVIIESVKEFKKSYFDNSNCVYFKKHKTPAVKAEKPKE